MEAIDGAASSYATALNAPLRPLPARHGSNYVNAAGLTDIRLGLQFCSLGNAEAPHLGMRGFLPPGISRRLLFLLFHQTRSVTNVRGAKSSATLCHFSRLQPRMSMSRLFVG